MARSVFLCLLVVLPLLGASPGAQAEEAAQNASLIADKAPRRSSGVFRDRAITDGEILPEGSPWNTHPGARFEDTSSTVEYDLGEPNPIRALLLQGDNNDEYEVAISSDGENYETLWIAPKVDDQGLRTRFVTGLDAVARFVRVRPLGGDGNYSVSELQAYTASLSELPQWVRSTEHVSDTSVRTKTLLFGFAWVTWLVLSVAGARWWWVLLIAIWPLAATYDLIAALQATAPPDARQVSLVRGVVAAVAAIAVGWERFTVERLRPKRLVVLTVLAVCGAAGFCAFYNLGSPQFYDRVSRSSTYVHYLDLRQYYTTAKYFDEIGYDGIYAADVAAYIEDVPGRTLDSLSEMPMRNLETLDVGTVADERAAIEAAPGWFTPERWDEYRRDTGFFRNAMGDRVYLETLLDMGGNATPVWLSTAHLLFGAIGPSNAAFLWTATLDPLLILLALAAIGYAFGPRTMLVCMVIFGANDFIMYGSNWGGATLRHDWMAYLAFGACALQRRRFGLGGFLFSAAAMIRAFPALALVGAALPTLWWCFDVKALQGAFPGLATTRSENRDLLRIFIGAAVGVAMLLLYSVIVLPADAWWIWIQKLSELSAGTQRNHISLRLLMSGWEGDQYRVLLSRMPVYVGSIVVFSLLVIVGARRATRVQGALLGLTLIPVIFYPANYYIHFVWLLPMLAVERAKGDAPVRAADAWVWIALLAMCSAQYLTVFTDDLSLHFWLASVLLFVGLVSVLLIWANRDRINARLPEPVSTSGK